MLADHERRSKRLTTSEENGCVEQVGDRTLVGKASPSNPFPYSVCDDVAGSYTLVFHIETCFGSRFGTG